MIPIELKYKTRQYSGTLGNEKIYLKTKVLKILQDMILFVIFTDLKILPKVEYIQSKRHTLFS